MTRMVIALIILPGPSDSILKKCGPGRQRQFNTHPTRYHCRAVMFYLFLLVRLLCVSCRAQLFCSDTSSSIFRSGPNRRLHPSDPQNIVNVAHIGKAAVPASRRLLASLYLPSALHVIDLGKDAGIPGMIAPVNGLASLPDVLEMPSCSRTTESRM